jgi:pilus assembly protein Flp/PilA
MYPSWPKDELPKIRKSPASTTKANPPHRELGFDVPVAIPINSKGDSAMFVNSIKRFLVSEDGPTAVEYAVMLALIIVVCLTAIQAVGTNANNQFNAVKNALT